MRQLFLIVWCNKGLEYIGNYTEYDQARTWAALSNTKCTVKFPNLMHLELRARYNPQRHYEIYIVETDESVTADSLRALFESCPQVAADLIRERGHCYYSDRADQARVKIV